MCSGWTSIPWFVYYYTLGGYSTYDSKLEKNENFNFESSSEIGLTEGWCKSHHMLHNILPSLCHTTTMWLTVFLAVQRFV